MFCSRCAAENPDVHGTYTCSSCRITHYVSPSPVVVGVIPVERDGEHVGFLGVRRNIEPRRGEWALPGGFLDPGESFAEGVSRELFEESGLSLVPERILCDRPTPDGRQILVFLSFTPLDLNQVPEFANGETMEVGVVQPGDLCFPLHREACVRYLEDACPPSTADVVRRPRNG